MSVLSVDLAYWGRRRVWLHRPTEDREKGYLGSAYVTLQAY